MGGWNPKGIERNPERQEGDLRRKEELARQELDKLMGLAEAKKRSETALLNENEADGQGAKGEKGYERTSEQKR